jgi:hypothetical protein
MTAPIIAVVDDDPVTLTIVAALLRVEGSHRRLADCPSGHLDHQGVPLPRGSLAMGAGPVLSQRRTGTEVGVFSNRTPGRWQRAGAVTRACTRSCRDQFTLPAVARTSRPKAAAYARAGGLRWQREGGIRLGTGAGPA